MEQENSEVLRNLALSEALLGQYFELLLFVFLSWSPFSAFPLPRPRLSPATDVSVFRAVPGLDSSQGGTR